VLRDIGIGHGEGIEGRNRVGDAVLGETLRQELRVAGAACLIDEAAASVARTCPPPRAKRFAAIPVTARMPMAIRSFCVCVIAEQ